jgi:hypothetical protein
MADNMTEMESGSARPAPPTGAVASRGVIDAKHEAFRRYTLVGRDDKEIVRTAGELLEGSNLLSNRNLTAANLTAVFKRIAEWCEANSGSLQAALMTIRPGRLSLFFVASAERYDLELDQRMTELEVQLSGSAGVGSVESFQIPERSVDQFVGRDAWLLWQRAA